MPTAEHCRTLAAEADRLASIVSYTRDKVRLREQAKCWRDQADALEAHREDEVEPVEAGGGAGLMGWLRRRVG